MKYLLLEMPHRSPRVAPVADDEVNAKIDEYREEGFRVREVTREEIDAMGLEVP